MPEYIVPIRIVEHGREVRVEAETRAEARSKARRQYWLECSDVNYTEVFIVGAVQELKDGE